MPEQPGYDLDERRLELLNAKLRWLFEWEIPLIQETIGPYNPTAFDAFDKKRRDICETCALHLRQYSDEEIEVLHNNTRDEVGLREEWSRFANTEINLLMDRKPPWFAGGFGHPDYAADFEYWCKMPRFSIEEVLCLSVGVDPKHLNEHTSIGLHDRSGKSTRFASIQFLLARFEQINRTFSRSTSKRSVFPKDFVEWCEKVELHTHPEFLRLLKRYHMGVDEGADLAAATAKKATDDKRPDKRQIDKIAQLFTLMAIECYGYVPGSARSPIPKEITDFAAENGISISDDTVRKYLKLGASFLTSDDEANS